MQAFENVSTGSVGIQNQLALFVTQMSDLKLFAQICLLKMQGTVDSVTKERQNDPLFFEQLVEGLRLELGQVKEENAALKKGMGEQKKILETYENACPPPVAPPSALNALLVCFRTPYPLSGCV